MAALTDRVTAALTTLVDTNTTTLERLRRRVAAETPRLTYALKADEAWHGGGRGEDAVDVLVRLMGRLTLSPSDAETKRYAEQLSRANQLRARQQLSRSRMTTSGVGVSPSRL